MIANVRQNRAESQTGRWLGRSGWVWLAAYLFAMGAIVVGMGETRRRVLATLDTPEGRADWQAWREAPANQPNAGPVSRRPPKSNEPPAVVLMRDHFAVMLAGALIFGSLLFATLMVATRGALARAEPTAGRPN